MKSACVINISLAEEGSLTYHKGTEYKIKAIETEKRIDTVGCGDCYHGAFLCNYYKYQDIKLAMQAGTRAAYENLLHYGP